MLIGAGADVLDVVEASDPVRVVAAHHAADVAVIATVLTWSRRHVRDEKGQ